MFPNALFISRIKTEVWIFGGKIRKICKENVLELLRFYYLSNNRRIKCRNLEVAQLIVYYSKAFNFVYRRNMELILLAYAISKETVSVITLLYKNTRAMVGLSDSDFDFIKIVTAVMQMDTFTLYLSIICFNYVLLTSIDLMIENAFALKMARRRGLPGESITEAGYTNRV